MHKPKSKTWVQLFREHVTKLLEPLEGDRSRPIIPAVLRDVNGSESFDEDRLRIALKVLTQMSMITHHDNDDETRDSYSIHPLVHTWIRERPQISTGEQAIWCQAATTTLTQCILLPVGKLASTDEDEMLRRDILLHVMHVQKCQEEIRARIVNNQKTRKSMWPVLQPKFTRRKALQYAKFSIVYAQCGFWDEAEQLQLAVKNFIVPILGMEHPMAQQIVLALSTTLWQQTRANEAADLQQEVLDARLSSLGPDHPRTLKVTDDLGVVRCLQGRFHEAEALHRRAVEGMTKGLGPDHEDTLVAVDNLGRVMFKFFNHKEARVQHEEAIVGMEKVLGPTNLKTLSAKESLAMAYMELGGTLLDRAHDLMEEVFQNRRDKLGKEQPYTLIAISNLAQVKTAMGRTDEAEELLLKILPIAERNLGKNHIGVIAGRCRLAQSLTRQRRFEEAETIYNNILERHRYAAAARKDSAKRLDDDHPDRIIAMYWLTDCYQAQGKLEEAIRVCDALAYIVRNVMHPIVQKVREKKEGLTALQKGPMESLESPSDPPPPFTETDTKELVENNGIEELSLEGL
jgi:tetratricopeptide (TPR) repeat protein